MVVISFEFFMINTEKIRKFFPAIKSGRIVSNNAASTQVPIQLLDLLEGLIVKYDNVHRGQSDSSIATTEIFEKSYDDIAQFIGAPSRKNIVLFRNATEAINCVMYSLMTEFKDGDNVVTTYMEHNSNYVPWYGMAKEILAKLGVNVEYRLAKFDKETGELDLGHLKSLVDDRTKIVCCTGASNFLGTKNSIKELRKIADASGYVQPDGTKKSYLLIDGCQTVPNIFVDVKDWDIDFLAWSFHKMLAPFGVGGLYAKEEHLKRMRPFLYGGDMIAEGQVTPEKVDYNVLPWKFTAGTPNILGTILSAQAIRLILDFALDEDGKAYFMYDNQIDRQDVKKAMENITEHERQLIGQALEELSKIPGINIYGPKDPSRRTSLIAFNHVSRSPFDIASGLNELGVESRAGCHCATLAHHFYQLNPPASCRLSFYVYNNADDVTKACRAVAKVLQI